MKTGVYYNSMYDQLVIIHSAIWTSFNIYLCTAQAEEDCPVYPFIIISALELGSKNVFDREIGSQWTYLGNI